MAKIGKGAGFGHGYTAAVFFIVPVIVFMALPRCGTYFTRLMEVHPAVFIVFIISTLLVLILAPLFGVLGGVNFAEHYDTK